MARPIHAVLIAQAAGWTNPREGTKYPSKQADSSLLSKESISADFRHSAAPAAGSILQMELSAAFFCS